MPVYVCEICDKEFASAFNLKRHTTKTHSDDDDDDEDGEDDESEDDEEDDEEDQLGTEEEQLETIGDILKEFIQDNDSIKTMDDLTDVDNYQETRQGFEDTVRKADELMYYLRRTKLFQGISRAIQKHRDGGCDDEEAEEAGWDLKKFALKYYISNNRDKLEAHIFPDDE